MYTTFTETSLKVSQVEQANLQMEALTEDMQQLRTEMNATLQSVAHPPSVRQSDAEEKLIERGVSWASTDYQFDVEPAKCITSSGDPRAPSDFINIPCLSCP